MKIVGILLLHLIWFLAATYAGMLSVFVIGVPSVGDNPGAAGAFFPAFLAVYLGLIALEAAARSRYLFRRALPRVALDVAGAVAASLGALLLAVVTFALAALTLSRVDLCGLPDWLPLVLAPLVLAFETALTRLGASALRRASRTPRS